MEHIHFKADQTAASYVADGLDERTQEAFELHLMGCAECVDDVEVWRAIKLDMPKPQAEAQPAMVSRRPTVGSWRLAASFLAVSLIGLSGGWFGKSLYGPDLESTQTIMTNMISPTRGAEDCTTVLLAANTRRVIVRLPGVPREFAVAALNADRRELPASQFSTRLQPDGSRLLQMDAQVLQGRRVRLESRSTAGASEPLGCVSGETP